MKKNADERGREKEIEEESIQRGESGPRRRAKTEKGK